METLPQGSAIATAASALAWSVSAPTGGNNDGVGPCVLSTLTSVCPAAPTSSTFYEVSCHLEACGNALDPTSYAKRFLSLQHHCSIAFESYAYRPTKTLYEKKSTPALTSNTHDSRPTKIHQHHPEGKRPSSTISHVFHVLRPGYTPMAFTASGSQEPIRSHKGGSLQPLTVSSAHLHPTEGVRESTSVL